MLEMHFRADLVVLSILVATLAGYVSLDLTQRALRVPARGARGRWVLAAALTMGLGIWSMHFLGMLALDLDRPVEYRLGLVAISMVAAVLGAGVAVSVITRPGARRASVFTAAGYMGAAVAAMHYTGIAGMQVDARISWSAGLVGLSALVAYAASLFALATVFAQRSERSVWPLRRRLAAAGVLGLGVSGLHYLAMFAMHFEPTAIEHVHGGLETGAIATLLVVASAVMLVILLAGAQLDQRRAATASDLAAVAAAMREIGRSKDARASIGRAACELTGATMGGLFEPDGQGGLVLTGAHGIDAPLSISFSERSAAGTVFLTRQDLFVSDIASSPEVGTLARSLGVASALYEPVVLDDDTVGVLVVAWQRRLKRVEDRSVSVARLLAAEAAFVIERADLTARLESLARTDELTGLPNRRTADEELGRFLARSRRAGQPLSVAMIDLDHFKAYNDRHGHAGGDRLLQEAAKAWSDALRSGDLLSRYGGEEFVAVFPECGLEDAGAAAERLRAALPGSVTCSIGVALWNRGESAHELLGRADAALYKAKAGGRDRVVVARETSYLL
jgi:diguanylate cyclase (GGDEF)-like protein